MTRTDRYYPSEICFECGYKHGRASGVHAISVWDGKCGWCGHEGTVTAPRDFRYPEFTGPAPDGWDKA